TVKSPPQMLKTYIPPATSELARSAAPAIALYQLRLKRRKGRSAENVEASIRFIRIPLLNAYGSQISEHTRCQKVLRIESRLTNRSTRSIAERRRLRCTGEDGVGVVGAVAWVEPDCVQAQPEAPEGTRRAAP